MGSGIGRGGIEGDDCSFNTICLMFWIASKHKNQMFIKILLLAYKKLINYGFQRTKRVQPLFLRDLSYNKIVSVNSFEGEALTALYMDHNLIERVHGTAFSNLTQLRYL